MHTDLLFGIEENKNQNRPFWRYFASKRIDIFGGKIDVRDIFLPKLKIKKMKTKKKQ